MAGKSAPGGPRRRPAPRIRVKTGRSPAVVAGSVAVGVLAAAIIGYTVYTTANRDDGGPPAAPQIPGLVNYRQRDPTMLTRNHVQGTVTYRVSPPVGGDHNAIWQNCMGDVYSAAIANENAVHSLEHGAVWITYNPSLPADQVNLLAGKVRGTPYLFMSPYPGLDTPISLQAWGYQPKLDSASDPRTDQFIQAFRITAAPEPHDPCSAGVTATGTTPHNTPGGG